MYIVVYNSQMQVIGLINDVEYEINKRVYDLDTSSFAGVIDEVIEDPFFFLFKNNDFEYAGWIKNFKQDGKLITFQGIDLKSLLDTDIELDFNDYDNYRFELGGIINITFDSLPQSNPEFSLNSFEDETDIVHIGNYSFQVVRVNLLQFLKPYLVLYNYYIDAMFDEEYKQIYFSVIKNNNTMMIEDKDFVLEENRTSTKTNHTVASLIQVQEEERNQEIDFIPTSKVFYESQEANRQKDASGRFLMTAPLDDGKTSILVDMLHLFEDDIIISDDKIEVKFKYDVIKVFYSIFEGKGFVYIPYHKNFAFKTRSNQRQGDYGTYIEAAYHPEGTIPGLYVAVHLSLYDGMTYPYREDIKMNNHNFTDLGQGFMYIDIKANVSDTNPPSGLKIVIPLIEPIPLGERNDLKKTLAKGVVVAHTSSKEKLGIPYSEDADKNGLYAKPMIEHYENERELMKNVYKVSVSPYNAVLRYNGDTSTTIPNGDEVFNKVGDYYNIPVDRITLLGGTVDNEEPILQNGVVYQDDLPFRLENYSFMEGGYLINFDFGGWGYFRIDYNYNIEASGQGGWIYRFTVNGLERYWQVGQVPKREKRLLQKHYYLGKDNQVYEETIPSNQKIYPEKVKYFQEEFLYNAQNKAITELVNSRYDMSIMVVDNDKINPYELSKLGLLAQINVVGKNGSVILPISEIIYTNKREQQVKLGFKKMLFTEVIKYE